MRVTKRRLLLGIAGCLITLVMAAPVSAGGQGHGTVDVNDVTKDPHGGLVKGSDGGERNINAYLPMQTVRNLAFSPAGPQNSGGGTVDTKAAFLYEEAVEFNPNLGELVRVQYYDEAGSHP